MKSAQMSDDNAAESYRYFVAECYQTLREKRDAEGLDVSLAEVKLRLFLSLLDKPQSLHSRAVSGLRLRNSP